MNEYYTTLKQRTNIEVKTILEIGSRDGEDAEKLKDLFNLTNNYVWIVEPNPNQIELIKRNYPHFNLIPKAIFSNSGTHEFFQVIGNSMEVGTSSLIARNDDWYDNKTNKIEVETITGFDLLKLIGNQVDVCKLDVEGLTFEVLESFRENIDQIKSFHLECEHKEVWKNQKLYDDVSRLLINNGYVQVYFNYTSVEKLQSDSIWVLKNFIKN